MKVTLKVSVMPGVDLEVHEASVEELRELCDSIRPSAPRLAAEVAASHVEQLVAVGVALGCDAESLRNRPANAIPLADGIRQVAETAARGQDFWRKATQDMAAKADLMRPVVEAARDCTCLCDCGSLNALKMAVAAYEEVSKAGDSSASPSAEGSTTSPSKAGDSSASPSNCIACLMGVPKDSPFHVCAAHRCTAG